jgi:glycosyltransferase involved in cell wall biosynthesis
VRIAQVAPLAEAVPPLLYGGTERVVSYLTEALVALGHDVTLFASAESETEATLVPAAPRALRLAPGAHDPVAPHVNLVQTVLRQAAAFDVVHFHIDHVHLPAFAAAGVPYLTTMHGRLDLPELPALFQAFPDAPLVSISDAQRRPLPGANFVGTVYHGLPADLLRPSAQHEGYLAFLGRVCPEKGVDKAIRIAAAAGMPLRIAAKVDKADEAYFAEVVRPMLGAPGGAEFVGEIGQAEMGAFLGGAAALLCPIDWPEPFGLVLIEATACGTPAVAFDRGSVPEVVEDGVAGFVVRGEAEAVAAVGRLPSLDRRRVREAFDRRFTSARMAADYVRLYERLVQADTATPVREATDRFASAAPIRTNRAHGRDLTGVASTSPSRSTDTSAGLSTTEWFPEQAQADPASGAAGKAMAEGSTRGRAPRAP